jgi:2-polyprenyl-6-hydroxyphenyl methylase/3-demethylubiquinone-9 3-methyltransferase
MAGFGALRTRPRIYIPRLRPLHTVRTYGQNRGMSRWRNVLDCVGGYPLDLAKPEEIFDSCRQRGFELKRPTTRRVTAGCCRFVFRKAAPAK